MRQATVARTTRETDIQLSLNIDGTGQADIASGMPFFDHMLEQLARHGQWDIQLTAKGDLEIDQHHTVEDIGIVMGQALHQALGNKSGIVRYGHAYVPLDEALTRVVVDLSGRPGLDYHVPFTRSHCGQFDLDLLREFFQALVNHAALTLHIDNLKGVNAHHQAETVFKASARALRMAVAFDSAGGIPSTKGVL